MTIDEISGLFSDGIVICTGDGMIKHRDEIAGENIIFAPANHSEVRAASVAALALAKSDTAVNYNMITPLYLRKSQAERELENKKKGLSDK